MRALLIALAVVVIGSGVVAAQDDVCTFTMDDFFFVEAMIADIEGAIETNPLAITTETMTTLDQLQAEIEAYPFSRCGELAQFELIRLIESMQASEGLDQMEVFSDYIGWRNRSGWIYGYAFALMVAGSDDPVAYVDEAIAVYD